MRCTRDRSAFVPLSKNDISRETHLALSVGQEGLCLLALLLCVKHRTQTHRLRLLRLATELDLAISLDADLSYRLLAEQPPEEVVVQPPRLGPINAGLSAGNAHRGEDVLERHVLVVELPIVED